MNIHQIHKHNLHVFHLFQELGFSKSSYSLSDQLKLNNSFNDNDKTVNFDDVENLVRKMRRDWNVCAIVVTSIQLKTYNFLSHRF